MKKVLVLLCIFGIIVFAQNSPNYMKISTVKVGPGAVHYKYWEPIEPWTLNVLEIDLTNPDVMLESVKAGDKLGVGNITSVQAENHSYAQHEVIGAINGDFFGGTYGYPLNSQVANGEFVKHEDVSGSNPSYWSTFQINEDRKPAITQNQFNSRLYYNGTSFSINTVNYDLQANRLVLYNKFRGSSTGTGSNTTEFLVSPVNRWLVNDTVKVIVEQKVANVGNMTIPDGKAVLSANGTAATTISPHINVGDTVAVYIGLTHALPRVTQLIGGFPRIVRNGSNYAVAGYYNEGGGATFHTDLHPRTAVGFNADSTKVYFVTVDGRQNASRGMSLSELADFMIHIGVAQAVNLDGGGSTAMYVRGEIENVPSDGLGTERVVKNSLVAFTALPHGSLSAIQVEPDYYRIFEGESVQLKVSGWDENYNPVEITQNNVQFTVLDGVGSVDNNKMFTASDNINSGKVVVSYNGLTDTVNIDVKTIERLVVSPRSVITDTSAVVNFSYYAFDSDNIEKDIAANAINWYTLDNNIAVVTAPGSVKGVATGSTKVIAQYRDISDTVDVEVVVLSGEYLLSGFENETEWGFSGENLNMSNSSLEYVTDLYSEGSGSAKMHYEYTGNTSVQNFLKLTTDMAIAGLPDSIFVDAMTDGTKNQVQFIVSDDNDELFKVSVKQWANNDSELVTQPGAFANATPLVDGSVFNFPIRLKEIYIKLGGPRVNGEVYSADFWIDNLKISYPGSTSAVEYEGVLPTDYKLLQNYPNPFNPSTKLAFSIPETANVSLQIYDVLGRKVADLVNKSLKAGMHEVKFDATGFASGIYFYKLQANDFISTKKMLLLK